MGDWPPTWFQPQSAKELLRVLFWYSLYEFCPWCNICDLQDFLVFSTSSSSYLCGKLWGHFLFCSLTNCLTMTIHIQGFCSVCTPPSPLMLSVYTGSPFSVITGCMQCPWFWCEMVSLCISRYSGYKWNLGRFHHCKNNLNLHFNSEQVLHKTSTWYSRLLISLLNSDSDIATMLLFNIIYLDQWKKYAHFSFDSSTVRSPQFNF